MGNCYFFGDSFTSMLVLDSPWYMKYKNRNQLTEYRWTDLISKFFEMENKNFGLDGSDNQTICDTIIETIPKMKKGDNCFIISTVPTRIKGYDNKLQKISYINSENIHESYELLKNNIDYNIDKNSHEAILNYIISCINPYISEWDVYYNNIFKNITNVLQILGINTFYTDYKIWNEFETISKETNGKINDNHWSENGNIEFYNFIKKQIDKENIEKFNIFIDSTSKII